MPSEEPFPPAYVAALRRMSPAERLRTGRALDHDARRLETAMLRAQHPDWSAEQIERAVRNLFLHGAVDV